MHVTKVCGVGFDALALRPNKSSGIAQTHLDIGYIHKYIRTQLSHT